MGNQMTAMQHQPGMPSTQGGIVGSITNMFAPTQAPGGVMQNIQQRMHLAMQMEYQQGTLFRPRHSPMHPVPATSPDGRIPPKTSRNYMRWYTRISRPFSKMHQRIS